MFSAYLPTRMDGSFYRAMHDLSPYRFDPRIAGFLLLRWWAPNLGISLGFPPLFDGTPCQFP
jgi:hypothetical protein